MLMDPDQYAAHSFNSLNYSFVAQLKIQQRQMLLLLSRKIIKQATTNTAMRPSRKSQFLEYICYKNIAVCP